MSGETAAFMLSASSPLSLTRLSNERMIDARGARLDQFLLDRLLDAVRGRYGQLVLREAHLEMATFEAYAYFANATFEGALHGLE